MQDSIYFHLEGHAIHLKPIAPGWKHSPTIRHKPIQPTQLSPELQKTTTSHASSMNVTH